MELSIIIPTKERDKILLETLEKIIDATKDISVEIIVVNDSKKNKIKLQEQWQDKIIIIENTKNGVASARNLGAKTANADLLLFIDDDMLISNNDITTTIKLHKEYQTNVCFNFNWKYPNELRKANEKTQFGRYLSFYSFDSYKGWCSTWDWWDDENIFEVWGITSQYLSINKDKFFEIGGYNEEFPHAGFEDHDFSLKIFEGNIKSFVNPSNMIYHNEVDRMHIASWLERKRRGGESRKVAVLLGYKGLAYDYGKFKTSIYKLLLPLRSVIYKTLSLIPNIKILDPIYFMLLNALLGLSFFEGYTKNSTDTFKQKEDKLT